MLILNGYIINPETGECGEGDIEIAEGKIKQIVKRPERIESEGHTQIIDAEGLVVAPGLIDVHVHFRDPGLTYKEDIQTGAKAAARGGFTTVVCMANTKPPVDNPETLKYVLDEGKKTGIRVFSAATVSKGMQGKELTDMEALKAAGAVAFTDDGMPITDIGLLKTAMEQAARLQIPLSVHEEDPSLIQDNGINHGKVSEQMGIYGSPSVAEDTMVARDCMLAMHTGVSLDIQHISSAGAVKMVQWAKSMGAHVVAEVTPHHFSLTEEAVLTHQTLAKMNPPLRTESDRQAIIQGLKDGTIQIIATDHAPHSKEEKNKPFSQAPSGIIGLETALSLGITNLVRPGHLSLVQLVEKMSLRPAQFYGFDSGIIDLGRPADLVIFHQEEEWVPDEYESKSENSPFTGEKLFGKVKYTLCNGTIVYEENKRRI